MNIRRSKTRQLLPTERMDEYNAILIDKDHYTLEGIQAWLAKQGIEAKKPSIHQDRKAALAPLKAIHAKRDLAIAMTQLAQKEGWPIGRLNVEVAGQKIFDSLMGLEEITPDGAGQAIRLLEATAKLRSAEAKAQLVDVKREELRDQIAAAKAAADEQVEREMRDRLSTADIERIKRIYNIPTAVTPVTPGDEIPRDDDPAIASRGVKSIASPRRAGVRSAAVAGG